MTIPVLPILIYPGKTLGLKMKDGNFRSSENLRIFVFLILVYDKKIVPKEYTTISKNAMVLKKSSSVTLD